MDLQSLRSCWSDSWMVHHGPLAGFTGAAYVVAGLTVSTGAPGSMMKACFGFHYCFLLDEASHGFRGGQLGT
jgi:hypothetical protein